MQYLLYILWHYISLLDDTSISYVRKSVKSRRILTQSRLSVVIRREGLYTSHLSAWRKACRSGSLQGLTPNKRGAKPAEHNPLSPKVRQLEAKVTRLEKELATAHTILDVQSRISGLLGFSLNDGKDC